ncbi:MAG TPA: polysaccharide biosynthesis/export family protein, partial [Nitrospirota bacterium]|nr:polysaccharide biosynthesis/export family protein [Nitrospirota bacterium]
MKDRIFNLILPIIVLAALTLSTGCARYTFVPSGTIKQVTSPIIDQETISLTPEDALSQPLEDTYYLGPGDMIFINISGKPEFSSFVNTGRIVGSRVDGKGAVHIPIVGTVKIAGLNVEQAQEAVRNAAKQYLREPWVVVEILEYRAKQVFVFGAVKKPGAVPMMPAGLSLAQAIATAELRDAGNDFRHVRIIRSLTANRGELYVLDFDKIMRGDALPFPLKDGDIVYVPKNSFGTWNDAIAEMLPSLNFVSALLQ